MRAPKALVSDTGLSGYWEIWVDPQGNGQSINVTKFRGAATTVDSLSTTDPFGPQQATLSFSTITLLDRPGTGDLYWLLPEANVDICWVSAPDALSNQSVMYRWQGYFVSFEYGEEDAGGKLTVTCTGALHQMDNYIAKPEYLQRPLAYEYAIYRQFQNRRDSRLAPMDHPATIFPSWWSTRFSLDDYPTTQPYLVPLGPANGEFWSGMVTRETGKFEPVLTTYIQTLLSNMYTDRGQFTLLLGNNRKPYLVHRDHKTAPDASTLVVHVLWPGVQVSVSLDYSQRVGVIYGQGRSLSGNTFSNMQVTADGSRTFYTPFAARRDVFPADPANNPWFDQTRMRKEVSLSFSQGIDAQEATEVSRKHLQRFSEPGITGQITLKTDPTVGGIPYARQMVQAGQTIQVQGLFGTDEGVLFHITEAQLTGEGDLSLTVDSKYRDALTVAEVRKRGRDALVPIRMLSVGQFQPLIPDLLHPWSYDTGSGFMPIQSYSLFKNANQGSTDPDAFSINSDLYMTGYDFPWEGITAKYPPQLNGVDTTWASCYVHMPPADTTNPDNNWAKVPLVLSAQGDIRLVQIAAFDAKGNPKKVPFHVSVFAESSTNMSNMPSMSPTDAASTTYGSQVYTTTWTASAETVTFSLTNQPFSVGDWIYVDGLTGNWAAYNQSFNPVATVATNSFTITLAGATGTQATAVAAKVSPTGGMHYPFHKNAWEQWLDNGQRNVNAQQYNAAATLMVGYGSYYEKAGYWPSSSTVTGAIPTGFLVDETGFSYNFITGTANRVYDQPSRADENSDAATVTCTVMIYCDEEWNDTTSALQPRTTDVYFLGRFFRKEPGTE